MTVSDIVRQHIIDNGFGGLANDNCGCALDDLCSCDSNMCDCVPAYIKRRKDCEVCAELEDCEGAEAAMEGYYAMCVRKTI